jgi:hypothetical protein
MWLVVLWRDMWLVVLGRSLFQSFFESAFMLGHCVVTMLVTQVEHRLNMCIGQHLCISSREFTRHVVSIGKGRANHFGNEKKEKLGAFLTAKQTIL